MDPSALIFVALAVAWAVYLVPKALEHTSSSSSSSSEEGLRSRTASALSRSRRVLARREPSGKDGTDLVTGEDVEVDEDAPVLRPVSAGARRRAARAAARRRTVVLSVLLVALVIVSVLAGTSVVAWPWIALPGASVVAWLVACRFSVSRQRAVWARTPYPEDVVDDEPAPAPHPKVVFDIDHDTGDLVAVVEHDVEESAEGKWAPVETPLPTYVSKAAAPPRKPRTIDLDATGVWSSGRNAADSALVREAEEAERAAREAAEAERRRATGS